MVLEFASGIKNKKRKDARIHFLKELASLIKNQGFQWVTDKIKGRMQDYLFLKNLQSCILEMEEQ